VEVDLVSKSPFEDVLYPSSRHVLEVLRRLRIESYQIAPRQNLGFPSRVDHENLPSKESRGQVVDPCEVWLCSLARMCDRDSNFLFKSLKKR
jgi:hypothetical protein